MNNGTFSEQIQGSRRMNAGIVVLALWLAMSLLAIAAALTFQCSKVLAQEGPAPGKFRLATNAFKVGGEMRSD